MDDNAITVAKDYIDEILACKFFVMATNGRTCTSEKMEAARAKYGRDLYDIDSAAREVLSYHGIKEDDPIAPYAFKVQINYGFDVADAIRVAEHHASEVFKRDVLDTIHYGVLNGILERNREEQ